MTKKIHTRFIFSHLEIMAEISEAGGGRKKKPSVLSSLDLFMCRTGQRKQPVQESTPAQVQFLMKAGPVVPAGWLTVNEAQVIVHF